MTNLAAGERVAKELARLNGVHLCQTCGHRRGEHAFDLVGEHFCEHNDGSGTDCCNCQSYAGVMRPNYAELVAALGSAAAALAACAREAREKACKAVCGCCAHPDWGYGPAEEENGFWFHRNVASGRLSGRCEAAAIRALERAAGERAGDLRVKS